MRHNESDIGSQTNNPAPILLCPNQTGLHTPAWGMCRGMRHGAGSGRAPASPPPVTSWLLHAESYRYSCRRSRTYSAAGASGARGAAGAPGACQCRRHPRCLPVPGVPGLPEVPGRAGAYRGVPGRAGACYRVIEPSIEPLIRAIESQAVTPHHAEPCA